MVNMSDPLLSMFFFLGLQIIHVAIHGFVWNIDIFQRLVQVSYHKIHTVIVEKHFYTTNMMQC